MDKTVSRLWRVACEQRCRQAVEPVTWSIHEPEWSLCDRRGPVASGPACRYPPCIHVCTWISSPVSGPSPACYVCLLGTGGCLQACIQWLGASTAPLFWAVIALRYGWGSTDSVDAGRVALSHPSRSSRLLTGPVDEWPSDPHEHVTRGVYDSCTLLRKACQGCYYVLAGLAPSCGPVQRPDVVLLERHAPGSALSVGGLASPDARVSTALGLYCC